MGICNIRVSIKKNFRSEKVSEKDESLGIRRGGVETKCDVDMDVGVGRGGPNNGTRTDPDLGRSVDGTNFLNYLFSITVNYEL